MKCHSYFGSVFIWLWLWQWHSSTGDSNINVDSNSQRPNIGIQTTFEGKSQGKIKINWKLKTILFMRRHVPKWEIARVRWSGEESMSRISIFCCQCLFRAGNHFVSCVWESTISAGESWDDDFLCHWWVEYYDTLLQCLKSNFIAVLLLPLSLYRTLHCPS